MTYGTVNVDSMVTSTGQILGAGNATAFKNRIINGGMVIDQRNSGASVTPTATGYALDRWQINISQSSKLSVQQNAGSITPPIGYINYLGVTSLSAYTVAVGDYFHVRHNIEGFNTTDLAWGTANAKTITLSFQVYSSLTGTFGGCLNNNNFDRSYPFTYSIPVANTWTSISITITGCTDGTWYTNNSKGIVVSFGVGVGSSYSGTAGSWSSSTYLGPTGAVSVVGTSGATLYITGVQLEVGTQATSFDFRDYGRELDLCRRYFELITGGIGTTAYVTDRVAGSPMWYPKRATPTLSLASPAGFTLWGWGTNLQNTKSVSTSGTTTIGGTTYFTDFPTAWPNNVSPYYYYGGPLQVNSEL